ncbi:trk system potassium uptake protein TrkA [Spiribacter vilamensis]|uniref:Trk system potassium uptake protein TrkA n=2 Tax=Spiribacter vilamensis TaxID=531306 RepID=A0A4Q8CYD6_9GAMM|nr:trk system potassium uptake protein TrkA [Spiribacter vilamensis]
MIVVIGAGTVGNSLIEQALATTNNNLVVVESDPTLADACAERHDVRVLAMDVGDDAFVAESQLARAEALIATTDDDSTNLMAVLLAKEVGVETLTATVNRDSHIPIFRRLGVRVLSDPERLVAQHLLDITLLPETHDVTTLRGGQQIIELKLGEKSPLVGLEAAEIRRRELLGEDLQLLARVREGKTRRLADGEKLAAGDGVILFAAERLRGRRRLAFRERHLEG